MAFSFAMTRNSQSMRSYRNANAYLSEAIGNIAEKLCSKWKLANNMHLNNRAMNRCGKTHSNNKNTANERVERHKKYPTFGLNELI